MKPTLLLLSVCGLLTGAGCGKNSQPPQQNVCDPNPCTELRKNLCVVENGNARCLCNAGFVSRPNGSCEELSTSNCPEHGGDADEPDDCQAKARALTTTGNGRARSISPAGDYDYFRFDAVQGDIYTATVVSDGPVYPRIDAFDQGGIYLAGIEQLQRARLSFKAATTAPHFLRVMHSPLDPSIAEGDYTITLVNAGTDDVGDRPQGSTLIAPDVAGTPSPRVFSGRFEYSADQDWYGFSATTGTRYTVLFDTGKTVPTVALFRSADATEPEFVTTQASLEFFVPTSGTVYLAVYPPAAEEGSYAFTFYRD